MRWMEPQSRFVVNTLLKRNLDTFTASARTAVNWAMLALDVGVLLLLLWLL